MRILSIEDELRIFTQNIIWLRKNYHISKRKMMKIMKIGMESLNRIEQGEFPKRTRIDVVVHTARHFHIKPADLLTVLLSEKNPE